VLWQGRKLGGVLIEVHGDAGGPCAAVIGVGINVRLSAEQELSIDQAVADLHQAGGASLERGEWLAAVLVELAAALHRFERSGFAPMRAEWDRYHAHAGRPVELSLPDGKRVHGFAAGVDAGGRLLLATDRGTQPITAGDVSLRASA
jgi:BirA family transcriptional regulator, biotin operon repressor / biotin---[acetyl-CoA-carboxylase] ligase